MATDPTHTGETVLEEAQRLIYGERMEEYGDAAESFERIAMMWSGVLGREVTSLEVCLCMIALKMARLFESPNHHDSVVDIAGYAGCIEKIRKSNRPGRKRWLWRQVVGGPDGNA